MSRYIVVDYDNGKSDEPRIAFRTDNVEEGKIYVDELEPKAIDTCIVFYDTKEDNVIRIIMRCEPINLVLAIEFARSEWVNCKRFGSQFGQISVEGGATAVIGVIAQRLAGSPMPGVSAAVLGHVLAPYFAVKGDLAAVGGAAAGMYGGMSGAIIGFVVGGPVGAFIGGAVGSVGLGGGAAKLIRVASHPNQCSKCKGVGLDTSYRRCTWCDGYGFTKGKL